MAPDNGSDGGLQEQHRVVDFANLVFQALGILRAIRIAYNDLGTATKLDGMPTIVLRELTDALLSAARDTGQRELAF